MKQLLTILFLFVSALAFSQNNGINFQGVGRNSSGSVIASQKISLRFTVIQSSETGTVEYVESKEVNTNAQGIFSVVIGDGTQTSKSGNFSDINWKFIPKFLKVEMDASGGSNFVTMGTTRLQTVPFAYYANGVNAENVDGVLSASKGGTGVASISALKTALAIDQINNTSDLAKPISTATQAALDLKANTNDVASSLAIKVDKVSGKGLSTNDFTTAEKNKLTAIIGTNTGDQDLSGYATTIALEAKANTNDVAASLATKVDKVTGKGLSTNDFTTSEKNKLTAITGTNTGDQDLSTYATISSLDLKVDKVTGKGLSSNDFTTAEKNKLTAITGANTGDQDLSNYATTNSLNLKVDKVTGKGLSTNDFTTPEKDKLFAIRGINTGDQDLSAYATLTELQEKASTSDMLSRLSTKVDKVTGKGLSTNDYTTAEKNKLTAITGTNTGDQDLSAYATLTDLQVKANVNDVTTSLATKVDKVTGKGLSTNDFSNSEKSKLAAILGTNTGDQDLSAYATLTELQTRASVSDVLTSLSTKVDKVTGKELSTNDFTTAEKNKLFAITGINTGDQDLSAYATKTELQEKESTSDVLERLSTKVDKVTGKGLSTNDFTDAEKSKLILISGTNTGDQDLSFLATKEELEESEDYIDANFAKLDEENVFTADQEIDGELTLGQVNLYGEANSFVGQFPFFSDGLLINNDEIIFLGSVSENDFDGWEFNIENSSITFPNESTIKAVFSEEDRGILIENTAYNSNFTIRTFEDYENNSDESYTWKFTPDGELIFPGGTQMGNDDGGFVINNLDDDDYYGVEFESGLRLNSPWNTELYFGNYTDDYYSGVSIHQGDDSNEIDFEIYNGEDNYWTFDGEGFLTFPDGTTFGNEDGEIGFTSDENDDFFIKTSEYNAYFNSYKWVFKSNGILKLPEDGDIVDWQDNSVISRSISEEFFVTLDGTYNNYQFQVDLSSSGLDFYSQDDYKVTTFSVNGFDYFDVEIPLEHTPKNLEQIIVYFRGDRVPKTNIFYNYDDPDLGTHDTNFEYNDSNNSITIRTYQIGALYWLDEEYPALYFSIDYKY
jgi:predicted CopG family antitoxin